MPTVHLIIKGKVQGVFYRATAKEQADDLKLTGWIKNTSDGNVEATLTGNKQSIDNFIEWCKQGPRKAKVEEVIVKEQEETSFDQFTIERR